LKTWSGTVTFRRLPELVLQENAMSELDPNAAETEALLRRVRDGDRDAVDQLFARHRGYLNQFVALFLDPKLRPRVDPSDVVQDAQLEAVRRLAAYLEQPVLPFRLWLRQITRDRLLKLRRHHLGTARRAVEREVPLPDRSSLDLAGQLLAAGSTPSQQVDRENLARRLRRALAQLPEADREVLLMRNFEGLSYQEVAYLLDIDPAAARKRHGRALVRLHRILFEGGLTESQL
jgi:RNA polymerase sigma-70 factor (ECF subfamily)